jgi:hypothetical protein
MAGRTGQPSGFRVVQSQRAPFGRPTAAFSGRSTQDQHSAAYRRRMHARSRGRVAQIRWDRVSADALLGRPDGVGHSFGGLELQTDTVRARLPRGALHKYAFDLYTFANGYGTSLPDGASWLAAPTAPDEALCLVNRTRDATPPGGGGARVVPTVAPFPPHGDSYTSLHFSAP